MKRKHTVTFTTTEVVNALRAKYPDEFSPYAPNSATLTVGDGGIFTLSYEGGPMAGAPE